MALMYTIKQIANQTIDAKKPAEIIYGTVVKVSPLTVRIDEKLEISSPQLIVMDGMTFDVGDKLVLLRNFGGQQFLILGYLPFKKTVLYGIVTSEITEALVVKLNNGMELTADKVKVINNQQFEKGTRVALFRNKEDNDWILLGAI